MTDFLTSASKASDEAAFLITNALRDYLAAAGWPLLAAQSVRITNTNNGFGVEFDGPAADQAEALEYGTEAMRPSAAVRKFLGQSTALENILMDRLESQLGELV